jgi:hypothetical protein
MKEKERIKEEIDKTEGRDHLKCSDVEGGIILK